MRLHFKSAASAYLALVSEMCRVESIKSYSSAKAVLTETEGETAIIGTGAEGTVSPPITLRSQKTTVKDCTMRAGTSIPGDL